MSSVLEQEHDLATIRAILLGAEYQDLMALQQRLSDPEAFSHEVANIIAEAIEIRNQQNDDVSTVLSGSVHDAVRQSIQNDTQAFADALYPVMGPAIRKSISETMSGMLERFNVALEHSISAKSLLWRMDAWRTGKPYSEVVMLKTLVYRVEQVFLIHSETSLLLHHLVSQDVVIKDANLVSGMLSAIQDFVKDSFSTSSDENLTRMSLGELTILIERGPTAILACAVRGEVPKTYRTLMRTALEQAHAKYAKKFDMFDGDTSGLDGLEGILRPCLQRQSQPVRKRRPWIIMALALLLLSALVYFMYLKLQASKRWDDAISALNQSPGIVVVQAKQSSPAQITILRDAMSASPQELIEKLLPEEERPNIVERGFISLENNLRLKRIRHRIALPDSASANVVGDTLKLSGVVKKVWLSSVELPELQWLGVRQLDTHDLNVIETKQSEPIKKVPPQPDYTRLIDEIELKISQWRVTFSPNQIKTIQSQDDQYVELAKLLIQLHKYSAGSPLALDFIGHTDSTGTEAKNRVISIKRAQYVYNRLQKTLQKFAPTTAVNKIVSGTLLSALDLYQKEDREEGRFVAIVLSKGQTYNR